LRGLAGPDAAAKQATLDTAAKREVIRMVAQISATGPARRHYPLPYRVRFAGLIAGDQDDAADELPPQQLVGAVAPALPQPVPPAGNAPTAFGVSWVEAYYPDSSQAEDRESEMSVRSLEALLLLLLLVVLVVLLVRTLVKRSRSESISHAKLHSESARVAARHVGNPAGSQRSRLTIVAEIAGILGAAIALLTFIAR
jgi:hypothetical protein